MSEGGRFTNGQFRQAFSVEGNTGCFQTVDELAVAQSVLTRRSVDPYDPEPSEVPFFTAPSDVSV
jgi:hypothetical protein